MSWRAAFKDFPINRFKGEGDMFIIFLACVLGGESDALVAATHRDIQQLAIDAITGKSLTAQPHRAALNPVAVVKRITESLTSW